MNSYQMQPSYGFGGPQFSPAYSVQDKGKGKGRDADFDAAFDQMAASFGETQSTSRIEEVSDDAVEDLANQISNATLDSAGPGFDFGRFVTILLMLPLLSNVMR